MVQVPADMQHLFANLFADFHKEERQRAEREAVEHPERYRDSLMMEKGKGTRAHYYEVPGIKKPKHIHFAYAQHRNLGGCYLSFTEVFNGKTGYRSNFHGWPTKKDAIEYCRERLRDSQKPKDQRKFVLPPFKKKHG